MTSSLVPDRDDVPSLASRVVSIDANTMLEVRPDPDKELWVDFTLTCDLHVRADDKIVMAGTERVHLDRGQGSIRLPAYTDHATTVDGSDNWGIVVRKSWATGCGHGPNCGCNGPYMIRVPAGTGSISLADLPAVKELTMREKIWRITGASVDATVGTTPGEGSGTAHVRNGVLELDLELPPTGPHQHRWEDITDSMNVLAYRGEIRAEDDLDTLIGNPAQGTYRLLNQAAEANGLGSSAGTLIVLQAGGAYGVSAPNTVQLWEPIDGQPLRRGHDSYGNWTAWGHDRWYQGPVEAGSDLNDILTPGSHSVDGRLAISNIPPSLEGSPFTLDTVRIGNTWRKQVATDENNRRQYRIHTGTVWRDRGAWRAETAGGPALASVEATGEWTTLAEEIALLQQLGQHREAEYFEVGTSVEGRPIPGIRVGFATEDDGSPRPTVLVTAGVHANERGTREGALRLVRELIQAETLARFRIGIIVIPNVNPDGFVAWSRYNANGVNLNRDFIDATQPETQAVRALVERENIIGAMDLHGGGSGLRVNFVGPDDTRHNINPAVMERSQRMFDAVWEYVLDHDEEPWLYPHTDGSDGEGLVGTFHNGIAADFDVPSLLLELPFISRIDRDDRHLPPRVWMAYAAAMFAHGAIDVIYRERLEFQAATQGELYEVPERYMSAIERGRRAYEQLMS